jgi:biotin carboxyl carrier protein
VRLTLNIGDRAYVVDVLPDERVQIDGKIYQTSSLGEGIVRVDGKTAWVARDGGSRWVFFDGRAYEILERAGGTERRRARGAGSLAAPMPATVRRILVSPGDRVKAGDTLMVLEAMKMELPIRAPADGTVRTIRSAEGDLVDAGAILIEMDDAAEGA